MMDTSLTIRLDETSARELEEAAKRSGRSKGEIIRELIRSHLRKENESILDAMQDCVGLLQDAPCDLSTNKKYLKNIGRRNPV